MAIDDYYIYYVEASAAKDVSIDYGFRQELTFCPSICQLFEPDNAEADHSAI